ncbi:MAG TPA: hypothetical protein VMS93_12400 [Candidatus Saccharimonadales bacterium]|nr:hypothetical protein [Candidatus Saccharimonadales bacterium]
MTKTHWTTQAARTAVLLAAGLVLAALAARDARAAFEYLEVDPRARAMGGAFTAMDGGALALFHNPASLALTEQTSVGATYVQPQGLDFVKLAAVGAVTRLPGAAGGLGIAFRRLATDYNDVTLDAENQFSLAHGFRVYHDVSTSVALGYALNVYNLKFGPTGTGDDPGSASTVGLDVGLRVTLRDRAAFGFLVQNLNNPTIGDVEKEDLPRRLVGGVAYSPYAGVTTTLDMESSLGQKVRFRGGTEFSVTDYGFLRFGVATDPNLFSAGLGLAWRGIRFDYGFSTGAGPLKDSHQVGLTITPALLRGGSPAEGKE